MATASGDQHDQQDAKAPPSTVEHRRGAVWTGDDQLRETLSGDGMEPPRHGYRRSPSLQTLSNLTSKWLNERLAANKSITADLDTKRDPVKPKRDSVPRLARVLQRQETVGERIIVRITVRKCGRQQDPDNAVWKSLVDQLRYCGAIPEDDGATIKLETDQIRVGTKKEEGTEVIIIYP